MDRKKYFRFLGIVEASLFLIPVYLGFTNLSIIFAGLFFFLYILFLIINSENLLILSIFLAVVSIGFSRAGIFLQLFFTPFPLSIYLSEIYSTHHIKFPTFLAIPPVIGILSYIAYLTITNFSLSYISLPYLVVIFAVLAISIYFAAKLLKFS